jgi:tetratricopeptide (TPR) repeat protein
MARDAMREYRAHLLPAAQSSLDGVLARANGSDLAAVLVVHASGSAAVVSAAYAAQKNPDDALAANNLGVTLRGMHDYARAAAALLYAKSKTPNSPVIASNIGWLALGQGDTKTASAYFAAASSKDNKLSPVLLGQGLIQQCAGHSAQALPLFRASIANGFSDLAEAGIDSAEANIASSKNSNAATSNPGVYGQNGGGEMPDWQDPPFPHDAATMARYHDMIAKYLDYWTQHATHAANGAMKVGLQVKGASTTGSNGKLVFERGYKKEDFVLGDIRGMIARDTAPIVEKWASDVMDRAMQQDGCHGCAGEGQMPSCAWRIKVVPIHAGLAAEEATDWTQLRKSFADVYGFSRPWLQQIQDPAEREVETLALEQWVTSVAAPFAQPMMNWQEEVAIDFNAGADCQGPGTLPGKAHTLKPYKIDPTKCNSGGLSWNFGFANLNADCDKMTVTIGEGLVGAAEWKFAPDYTKGADGVLRPTGTDWSNDQVTIFVGAGGGVNGPLAPNGAIGGFVTLQNGEVIDSGGQASAGISPGPSTGEGTGTLQVGVTGKVGMMSGPDVSTSAGLRFGMPCGFSC